MRKEAGEFCVPLVECWTVANTVRTKSGLWHTKSGQSQDCGTLNPKPISFTIAREVCGSDYAQQQDLPVASHAEVQSRTIAINVEYSDPPSCNSVFWVSFAGSLQNCTIAINVDNPLLASALTFSKSDATGSPAHEVPW